MILIPAEYRGPGLTPLLRLLDVPGLLFPSDTANRNRFGMMSVGPPTQIPGYAAINNGRYLPHQCQFII